MMEPIVDAVRDCVENDRRIAVPRIQNQASLNVEGSNAR